MYRGVEEMVLSGRKSEKYTNTNQFHRRKKTIERVKPANVGCNCLIGNEYEDYNFSPDMTIKGPTRQRDRLWYEREWNIECRDGDEAMGYAKSVL